MKKKVLSFLVYAGLCLALVGCANSSADKQNENARENLMKVLENEQTFIARTSVTSGNITEQKIEKYKFQTYDTALYAFVPELYAFVDCDSDGIDELVILDKKRSCYLILRYNDKKVYGYNYTRIGDVKKFKSDGSFEPQLSDGESKIARLFFEDTDFKIVEKAYINENENKYLLDGNSEDPDTVKEYFHAWNNTTEAEWIKICS